MSYSLSNPAWTDPTGPYAVTLDKFDRSTTLDDPAFATGTFTWAYQADGQVKSYGQPNGNTTAMQYDAVGHLLTKNAKAGATNRASYTWAYNRADQVLTEDEQIAGGASNGVVTYTADALGQLSASTISGATTAYGWDTATNRTSVQVGAGTPVTTAYNNANRPTSGANPSVTYGSDADGRMTARSGQTIAYDHLGRLTAVKNAAGTVTLAAYTYDPLDRLRIADYTGAGGGRVRFRYVAMSTSAVQWLDDVAGTVIRNIGTGWGGERLEDWDPTLGATSIRVFGENAHHDVTWIASNTGAVTASLRYDPWGNARTTPPAGYTPFRFQGSWYDSNTDLSWVTTRWYSEAQARFITEDTLLGDPAQPASRQLYAYLEGNPSAGWDPDGRAKMTFHPKVEVYTRGTGDGYAGHTGDGVGWQVETSISTIWPQVFGRWALKARSRTQVAKRDFRGFYFTVNAHLDEGASLNAGLGGLASLLVYADFRVMRKAGWGGTSFKEIAKKVIVNDFAVCTAARDTLCSGHIPSIDHDIQRIDRSSAVIEQWDRVRVNMYMTVISSAANGPFASVDGHLSLTKVGVDIDSL